MNRKRIRLDLHYGRRLYVEALKEPLLVDLVGLLDLAERANLFRLHLLLYGRCLSKEPVLFGLAREEWPNLDVSPYF
jgi:hypothetical protein